MIQVQLPHHAPGKISLPLQIFDEMIFTLFLSSTLIFFNIWSACCYSTGNTTLPNYTQWMQSCKTNSINMDSSTKLGINVPSWAELLVPGNTTFDLQKAVTRERIHIH